MAASNAPLATAGRRPCRRFLRKLRAELPVRRSSSRRWRFGRGRGSWRDQRARRARCPHHALSTAWPAQAPRGFYRTRRWGALDTPVRCHIFRELAE